MRPLIGTIHPDDYDDIKEEMVHLRAVNAMFLRNGLHIEVPDCRYWEYGTVMMMARKISSVNTRTMKYLDVGSGHGLMGPAMSWIFQMDVTECEPSDYAHRIHTNSYLKSQGKPELRVLPQGTDNLPDEQFDFVSCISVIEHMPADVEERCWKNLVDRVKVNGLLFIDVDCVPDQSRSYIFDNLRAHNFTVDEMQQRVEKLMSYGMEPIGEPDYNFNGAYVHDFTFFRIGMRKA